MLSLEGVLPRLSEDKFSSLTWTNSLNLSDLFSSGERRLTITSQRHEQV